MMGKVNAVKSIIWGGLCWCRLDTMPSTLENWKTFSSLNPAKSQRWNGYTTRDTWLVSQIGDSEMRVHPRQSASWTSGTWRGKCQLLPRLLPTCTKDLSQIILNHLIFSQFWQQFSHPGNWTSLAKFETKRGDPAFPSCASTVGWLLLRLSLPPTLLALMTPPKMFQTTISIFWKEICQLTLSKDFQTSLF